MDTTYESINKELSRRKAPKPVRDVKVEEVASKLSREEKLEDYLVALIMQADSPKEGLDKTLEIFGESFSKEKAYQKLLANLKSYLETHEIVETKAYGDSLPQELATVYDKSLLLPLSAFPDEKRYVHEVEQVARQLKDLFLREKLRKVSEEISKKEKDGTEDELDELKAEYSRLLVLLRPTHG